MKNWWNNFKYGLIRFMSGRYGTDELNWTLIVAALIMDILAEIYANTILMILSEALLIWCIYRSFSKRIYDRQKENNWFMDRTRVIRLGWKAFWKNCRDKQYHYYLCPKCHQMVRVPRHRGKIEITCPRCAEKFTRRS